MEFNLSSGDLINAGGGFLFFLAGLVILAVARQTRLGLRLGAFAVTFGLAYVVVNIVRDVESTVSFVAYVVPGLAAALCLAFLIREVLHPVSRTARLRITLLAAGLGLGVVLAGVLLVRYLAVERIAIADVRDGPLVFLVEPLLLVLLAASAQAPVGGSLKHYKGRLLLGLAAGLFAVAITMVTASSKDPDASWEASAIDGVGLLFGVMVAFTAWLVLRGCPPGAEPFARRAFVAIVLIGLLACLAPVLVEGAEDIGPYGIIRTAGVVLLVLAVVKYDVLGVPLPRLVVRRGALASAALAVLFIVAQVAQNFFSAQYGLYIGGLLAGGFVFAASPIQRAIERSTERQRLNAAASESAIAGYKAAVRAAMRDGILTRREERHLAEVAMALGITPVQALDLRDDVEWERA